MSIVEQEQRQAPGRAIPTPLTAPARRRARGRGERLLAHLGLLFICAGFLLPFLWMLSTSLKLTGRELAYPPELIPDPFAWDNYQKAFSIVPLCLGLLWVAFDPRKQGFHDKLAHTLVIRRKPEPVRFG